MDRVFLATHPEDDDSGPMLARGPGHTMGTWRGGGGVYTHPVLLDVLSLNLPTHAADAALSPSAAD